MTRWGLAFVVVVVACGGKPAAPRPDDAPVVPIDAAVVQIAQKPLGMADLGGFRWRARAGHAAFRAARVAENAEDWPAVVTACERALAADPTNLEAAWLVAVAHAKTGNSSAILAPLHLAAAGDLGKWGDASLEQPGLAAFRDTPTGRAWVARVEADRATYVAAIDRAVLVLAYGDVFAFDPEGGRWYRLTRTNGSVIGALAIPEARLVAYVTRGAQATIGAGDVNLGNGHATRPTPIAVGAGPVVVGYAGKPGTLWIGSGKAARTLVDGKLAPTTAARAPGAFLTVSGGNVVVTRPRLRDVSADYDEHGLASAIKLDPTSRVIAVPSPGLIDGSTIAWSPDRAHVAFVAQLDERCAPNVANTAAFIADATTGAVTELERATHGLALAWQGDRLAVAGDKEVALVDLAGTRMALVGAASLLLPRRAPPCVPMLATPLPTSDPADPDD
ncbi:MAG: bacterial transcriptional activator domain-containing protein [Proteobacteria bacterium]|nr:bacterial transcriptional activator domain-containing protein [Pseudomonadota bacterium]